MLFIIVCDGMFLHGICMVTAPPPDEIRNIIIPSWHNNTIPTGTVHYMCTVYIQCVFRAPPFGTEQHRIDEEGKKINQTG